MFAIFLTAAHAKDSKSYEAEVFVDKSDLAKSYVNYAKDVSKDKVDAWKLKYNGKEKIDFENTRSDVNLTCPDGFLACEDGHHACCATEERDLFSRCPKNAVFYADACWVKGSFREECPIGYTRKFGKCTKSEVEPVQKVCPEFFQEIDGVCRNLVTQDQEICEAPAYVNAAGDCVKDEELEPTCDEGYELNDDRTECTRTYTGPCVMKIEQEKSLKHSYLRKLGDKEASMEKYDAIKTKVDDKYADMKAKVDDKYTSVKTKAEAKLAPYKQKADDKYVIAKNTAYQAAIDARMKMEDKKSELEMKKDDTKEMYYEKKDELEDMKLAKVAWVKGIKEKEIPMKNTYEKVVKTECEFTDSRPPTVAVITVPAQEIREQLPGVIEVPVTNVCGPGFVYDPVKDICRFFDEQKVTKVCDGAVVKRKCLIQVPEDMYCEKPWYMEDDKCVREIYADGIFEWVRDYTCTGSFKYCDALAQYNKCA